MTCRETMEQARRAVKRLDLVLAAIEEGGEGLCVTRQGPRSGGPGDPTAAKAMHDMRIMRDLFIERDGLLDAIAEAGMVCEGLKRLHDSRPYGFVCERYYIDGASWQDVSDELGVPAPTLCRWRDTAFDLADNDGMAALKEAAMPDARLRFS